LEWVESKVNCYGSWYVRIEVIKSKETGQWIVCDTLYDINCGA